MRGLNFAVNDLLRMIWLWLVFGVVVSAALSTFINPGTLSDYTWATGISAMLLMLLISLPLYVCATASVPIAASLIAAGLPTGAALVFLMAGPATNIATIGTIFKAFGKKIVSIYLITVIAGSIGLALCYPLFVTALLWLLSQVGLSMESTGMTETHMHHHHLGWWTDASAVILSLLFIYFAWQDIRARISKRTAKDTAAAASCH
jgi:hypothetical protein